MKLYFVEQPTALLLFESVSAGFPSPAADFEGKKIILEEYLVRNPSATYLMQVEGDSMNGAGILDGDLVVIDRSLHAKAGDIVIAFAGGSFVIKRLCQQGKFTFLAPANPDYLPIVIEEHTEWEVWGVVSGVVRQIKN